MKAADLVIAHLEGKLKRLEERRRLSVRRRQFFYNQGRDLLAQAHSELLDKFPELARLDNWAQDQVLRPGYVSDADSYVRQVSQYAGSPQLARSLADYCSFVNLPGKDMRSGKYDIFMYPVPKKLAEDAKRISDSWSEGKDENRHRIILKTQKQLRDTIQYVQKHTEDMEEGNG